MIFKQDSVASLFGINNSVSIEPFKEAANVIDSYNEHIKNNTLTAENWNTILNQCDDTLAEHLEHIKGFETTMTGYTTSLQGGIVGYNKVNAAIQQYNSLIGSSKNEQQDLINTITVTNSKLGVYLSGLNGANASLAGYGLSLLTSTAKTIGLTIATTALNAALTMGISVIVTGAIAAFTSWINASKEITKNAQAAKDKIASITSDLKANTETVENSKQRYAELAQEVENLGKVNQSQGNLSNDEYKEFLDISNQLAGVFPSLTKGYDDNGNAILDLSGNVDTIVGSLDDLLQKEKELANKQIIDQIPNVYKDYDKNVKNATQNVKIAQDQFDRINEAYSNLDHGQSIQMGFDYSGSNKDSGISIGQYEAWLDSLGLVYKETIVEGGRIVSAVGDIDQAFTEKLESARSELQYVKQQLDAEKSSIGSYLNTWLQSDFSYNQIDDSGLQTAVKDIITNFDFTNLPDDVDSKNWDDVSEYLKRNIIFAISNLQNNPEIANALSQVFTNTELMPDEKDAYLSKITSYFGENNPVTSSLQPQVDEVSRLKAAYDGLISEFDDQSRLKRFLESNSINTQEEINYFKKVTKSAKTTTEAIRAYTKAKDTSNKKPFSTSEMISGINGLSEGFEELDKIMTSMKDKDKKFDYSLLDDKKFKDNFGGYTKEYDTFIKTITKNPKDIKACQDAFDNLANAFVYGSGVMEHLSDDNADVAKQYLELMGIQNADEVVTAALAQRHAEAAYDSQDLTNATYDEIVALAKEKESTEAGQKAFELYIAQKLLSNAAIDPTGDISALVSIIESLGLASDAWKNYYAAKREQESLSSAEIITGVNGEQIKKVTTDDKGNLLTHRDGKYYSADGTEYKGSTKSNLYSQKSENWLDQKTDVYYEEVAKELEAKAKNVQVSNYTGPKSTNPQKGAKGSKGSGNSKDPTQFDWIERKITLIDKQVDRLKTKIDTLVGYKNKNAATDTVIDLLNDKLTTLQKSTERYQEELSKIDIPQEYIDKIKNGGFDVDTIAPSDEALAKKIKNYQELYDKMVDCNDQITETTASIKELNLSKLDNIIDQYSKMSDIQSQILDTEKSLLDLREKQGDKIFASDYTPLLEGQLSLSKEYADAYNALAAEMSKMDLKEGSDEWKKYNDQLRDYKNNMISAASAVEDYKDAMTELVYKELTDFKSQMDSLNSSISTMSDLIGSTDLVDDAGNLTDRGIAQVALYAKQLANAKQEAAEYAEAIKSLDDALSSGLITQDEYNSMVSEYTSAQESAVKANKEARDAILSLVKDGIQAEIDAKKELTDQTKAALEAEQDLHEYQESIAEKSSNIAKLERQIAALSGSTDRADMAKKLQLQQDLAEAQKDLYDTQYDHEMEQRKQALDDEYDAFEESKNKESDELDTNLDKQNAAIEKYLDKVKANYSTAYNVLQQYGDEYSLAAIDSLTEPWDSSSEAANVCADAIGNVTANIQYEIDSLDFSSLYELADLLNQIGSGTYSGSYSGNFEDITGTGKWQQGKGGRWWYGEDYNENGDYDYASGGIYTIKGKQYGFDDEGYMITGWNDDSGEWRYFEPENGEMVRDSWRESNGKWYYLGSDGAMARDTKVKAMDGNGYYYVGDDGAWDGKDADAMDNLIYQKLKGKKVGYRNGTQNATPGWHRIDEEGLGSEVIVTKDGVLMKMNAGDEVFTKEQTDRLFEILKDPSVMTRGITAFNMKPNTDYAPTPVSQSIEVNMNVGGVVDEATLRVLNEQFPAMIKNNRKLITDTVGKGVKWQLKGK